MLRESRRFRVADYTLEAITAWEPPERLLKYLPGGIYGEDKCGNPVTYMTVGRADQKGLFRLANKRESVWAMIRIEYSLAQRPLLLQRLTADHALASASNDAPTTAAI